MHAGELFQSGRLGEAIAAAIQEVKDQPGDLSRRTLLFTLLCFEGDLDRARKQLGVVGNQMALTEAPAYENLIAAEEARRRVLTEGVRPKFLEDPPARLDKVLQAISCLQAKKFQDARSLLEAAEEERREVPGTLDGNAFDDIADADDITRSVFEFQQSQNYFWVPFEQLAQVQVVVPDPIRPRDLYWAPCQLILKSGATQRGFCPVLYAASYQAPDENSKLGLATGFHDVGGSVYRGTGRKQFVAGDADPTVFDLKDLSFN